MILDADQAADCSMDGEWINGPIRSTGFGRSPSWREFQLVIFGQISTKKQKIHFLEWKMAENGSVSGQYEGDNYASPSPSTGSGNSIRQMGGNSKELFDLFFHSFVWNNSILYFFNSGHSSLVDATYT